MQSDIRTVAGGSLVSTGLTLTAKFGDASPGPVIVPQNVSRIAKVTIGATSLGAVDGIAAARITGNGLAEGGEQWVTGPSLGVTAAGPLVGGATLERDVDIPVSPGNSLTLTHYVTTAITGDGSIEVVFE